ESCWLRNFATDSIGTGLAKGGNQSPLFGNHRQNRGLLASGLQESSLHIDWMEARGGVGIYPALKRASDLFLSALLLVALSPLLLLCALAVRFSSAGPVLFRQT